MINDIPSSRFFNEVFPSWRPRTTNSQNDLAAEIRKIRELSDSHRNWSDEALRAEVRRLRDEVAEGGDVSTVPILYPTLSLVAEAARRAHGICFYDVQLAGGLALAKQAVVEMQTGEGKTFVTSFPAVVHCLAGRGCHVMTVNAYLAERDYEVLLPIYEVLGLTAGVLRAGDRPNDKHTAYRADITHGPGYEFGFDFLRDEIARAGRPKNRLGDNIRQRVKRMDSRNPDGVQRGFAFAIIDEVDSVLIDEATTPLVLSEANRLPSNVTRAYVAAREFADQLTVDHDYVVNKEQRILRLTRAGQAKVSSATPGKNEYELMRPWNMYIEQALRAKELFQRDVDYVVQDGRMMLVDELTGRIFAERSWQDGLQQAIQSKEQIAITAENRSIARASRQKCFRMYEGLCGLTGTTTGSERELMDVYDLSVVRIPTNKPIRRELLPTRYFADRASKWKAIVTEVRKISSRGQPVLVGTRTIQISDELAARFREAGIECILLNGKQNADEAELVARAGQSGSVMIATNMAGRGTDIKLGQGTATELGLYVIGTERHESRRVDRQLIGRAGRQGDPGVARFFVAADDHLIQNHAPRLAARIRRSCDSNGETSVDFSSDVQRAQRRAERAAYKKRKAMIAADKWLDDVLKKLV